MISIIGNSRRPDIVFYRDGRIDIMAYVSRILSLHDGDIIDICVEGIERMLYVKQKYNELRGRHEAQCHPTKPGSRNFRCYSKKLASFIIAECNTFAQLNKHLPCENASLKCGEPQLVEGTVYIPVICRI